MTDTGLYTLFIIDDEYLVRKGLRLTIPWESFGYTIIGEAANGLEALQKIEKQLPDVVLTDMRMNVMDGMEMIPTLKKVYPHIKIIILTAYSDFQYAKTAINNDVYAYITKPAANEDIIFQFTKLKSALDQERSIQTQLKSYHHYRMDELLNMLLQNPSPDEKIAREFQEYLEASCALKSFFVALLRIENPEHKKDPSTTKQLSQLLTEKMDHYISSCEYYIGRTHISADKIALLVYTKSLDFQSQTAFLLHLGKDFQETTGIVLSIGVSTTFRGLSHLHRAYSQSLRALERTAQIGIGSIVDYMDIQNLKSATPVLSKEQKEEIIRLLLDGQAAIAEKKLEEYFLPLESYDTDLSLIQSDMTALASAIVRKAFFDNYTFQLIFDRNIKPSVEIQALLTVADIHNYMVVFCNKIATYTHELLFVNRLRKDCSPIVSEAISFIMSHYSRDIQIVDAADCLHISESRLMHAFKEETGKSFYAFLTEYRIYLAEIMMKNGRYKLYEISELVGYQNPLTFRRAFYRVTGSTPSKYRGKEGRK